LPPVHPRTYRRAMHAATHGGKIRA
jgi:hypothetical protein